MCRKTFAAVAAFLAYTPMQAQRVPGRELFDFPIASMAEAPALASIAGGGFWNPATLSLHSTDRLKASLSAFDSPIEEGVNAQVGTLAFLVGPSVTAGISVALASVGDLLRTDTDPQTIGGEIPYQSTILSAVVAAQRGAFTYGVAVRRRSATLDADQSSATSIDVGMTADRPFGLPVRAAASTFLLSPARSTERASALGALEAYLPWSTQHDLRAGASYQLDESGGDERFGYLSGRASVVEVRAGLAQQSAYNYSNTRLRLGVGVHYATYLVGVSRDDGTAGLGASYQFFLSTVVPKVGSP